MFLGYYLIGFMSRHFVLVIMTSSEEIVIPSISFYLIDNRCHHNHRYGKYLIVRLCLKRLSCCLTSQESQKVFFQNLITCVTCMLKASNHMTSVLVCLLYVANSLSSQILTRSMFFSI